MNFIQENSNDIVLWGFEEPENSFEYSMMSELAQKFFNEYSNKIQIFLTTHSFIFISYKSTNSSKYRVFSSEINRISTDIIKLNDESSIGKLNLSQDTLSVLLGDIGIIELNKELKTFYDERKELLLKISREYEKKKKPLVITEGESDVLYLNFAWSQINPGISNPFDIQAVSYYINGQTTNGGYGNIRKIVELKNLTQAKIVGIFDNDSAFNEFNGLKLLKTKTPLIKENLENNTFALLLPEPAYREGYGKIHVLNIEHYFENKTFEKLKIQFLKNSTSILENNTALSVEHFTIIVSNKIALAKKIISSHTLTDNEKLGFKNLFDLLDHIIK